MPYPRKPSLRLQAGGDWQAQKDLQNAQTSASSIVKDQAQRQGAAQVAAMQVPSGPGMDRSGFLARNPLIQQPGAAPNPQTSPGVSPSASPATPVSSLRAGVNTYTSAPAPTTPLAGGPITRVGNSFSNVSSPNTDPAYSGLKMDPFHAGNQQALSGIRPINPPAPEPAGITGGGGGSFRNVLGMGGMPSLASQRPGPSAGAPMYRDAAQAGQYGRSTVGLRDGGQPNSAEQGDEC